MIEKRFVYNAGAVPFAGTLKRVDDRDNLDYLLDNNASCFLSVNGGLSEGQGSEYERVLQGPRTVRVFRAGRYGSQATGKANPEKTEFVTNTRAFVESAVVIDRITVDSLASHLESIHGQREKYPRITPQEGTHINGLKLDGVEVAVELDLDFFRRHPTKEDVKRAAREHEHIVREFCDRMNPKAKRRRTFPEFKGVIVTTIVKSMQFVGDPPPGAKIEGNTIYWEDVGKVHVGELLISDYNRRLTMLRIQLGSPIEASYAMGDVESNGMTAP